MIFKRFFDPKLAQSSYLLGCPATREAVVVDPNRRADRYLRAASEEGLQVRHVTETHIHADFVSGSRELAYRAGARLYLSDAGGPEWRYHYAAEPQATLLQDGSSFKVGQIELRVWHLPGHTPEHLAFLVTDTSQAGEPMGMLTGDFLFVGDVGRPDLLEKAARREGTMEAGARQLYQSVQRVRLLPEYLQIWPGHGAGSACGKSLSAVPQSTLGYEKRFNWAFAIASEADFVRAVLAGQPEPPPYFALMKRLNQSGPRLLSDVGRPARLPVETLAQAVASGAALLDTRESSKFAHGAIPGSINIPANRAFTTWAGSLVPYDRELYLILDDRQLQMVDDLIGDLTGIGLDRIAGYYGPEAIEQWRRSSGSLQSIPLISLNDLLSGGSENGGLVLDVREDSEWKQGHIPGSLNVPLAELPRRLDEVQHRAPLIVHCQTGSRAAIAASLLRARGLREIFLFSGGFAEWRGAGQPIET
jgi:hydroxyacylglutathione hydrolase